MNRMQKNYTILCCSEQPCWDTTPIANIDHSNWLPNPGIKAWAQICCFQNALVIRLYAVETEPLVRFTGITDMVCLDSCVEFFFCPLPYDSRYFNFEFNRNGALYLGFGSNRYDSVRQLAPCAKNLFCIKQLISEDSWGIEFQIPFTFIRLYMPEFAIRPGLRLRGNFYKCGDETKSPHYLSWQKIHSETPDFHQPRDFGWLNFKQS